MADKASTQSTERPAASASSAQSSQAMQRRQRESGLALPDVFAGSPFQMLRRMTEEMDRAFERMFDEVGIGRRSLTRSLGGTEAPATGFWAPRIEAFQKDDKFIVRAELPGLKKDDVEVNVTDEAITIQGHRQEEQERKQEGFYHSERSYGSFYRTIPLPEGVITDTAEAAFKDGVLEIRLQAPPNEVSRGRRLEIKE